VNRHELENTVDSQEYVKHSIYRDVLAKKRLRLIIGQVQNHTRKIGKDKLEILDLGCGIGGITFPLCSLGHDVTAADIDFQSDLPPAFSPLVKLVFCSL